MCVCMCVCVCIHHIFLIQSSVDGHLGCFHVLATVKSAAMNNGVQVSFELEFLLFVSIYAGVGLLDCMLVLFLFF